MKDTEVPSFDTQGNPKAVDILNDVLEMLEKAKATLARIEQASTAIEAAKTAAQEHQARAATIATEIQSRQAAVGEVVKAAIAAQEQITSAQAVIAEKSAHIEDAQKHANTVRASLDKIATSAQSQLTEAEASRTRAQTASDGVSELQATVRAAKGVADSDAATLKKIVESANGDAGRLKVLADRAASIDTNLTAYEARLAEIDAQKVAQLEEITGLLPGATSAGLASAFDKRRQTFLEPGRRWQLVFIWSLVALVALAGSGLVQTLLRNEALDFAYIVTLWLLRLPIAGALVWLALHSSREAALAKRLEEDYGYKAAIASSFQGFNKQMKELASSALPGSALTKLCEDTLSTIASPPGRIYDRHGLVTSPSREISQMASSMADAVGKAVGETLKAR